MDTLDDQTTCWENKTEPLTTVLRNNKVLHKLCDTYMRSSTKRIFLFRPSIAFISSSDREKSNICSFDKTVTNLDFFFLFVFVLKKIKDVIKTYIKVLLYASGAKALWNDNHSSLDVEPQAHLCCGLFILFGD